MATKVVNNGLGITTNRLTGAGTTPSYVAWGTGAGTTAVTDTTLFTQAAETPVNGTVSRVTTTVTNDTFQVVGTLTSASAQTITNAGLLDAVAGTLFMKGDFTGIPLANGDSIQFTMKVQYTN